MNEAVADVSKKFHVLFACKLAKPFSSMPWMPWFDFESDSVCWFRHGQSKHVQIIPPKPAITHHSLDPSTPVAPVASTRSGSVAPPVRRRSARRPPSSARRRRWSSARRCEGVGAVLHESLGEPGRQMVYLTTKIKIERTIYTRAPVSGCPTIAP